MSRILAVFLAIIASASAFVNSKLFLAIMIFFYARNLDVCFNSQTALLALCSRLEPSLWSLMPLRQSLLWFLLLSLPPYLHQMWVNLSETSRNPSQNKKFDRYILYSLFLGYGQHYASLPWSIFRCVFGCSPWNFRSCHFPDRPLCTGSLHKLFVIITFPSSFLTTNIAWLFFSLSERVSQVCLNGIWLHG